MFRLIVASRLLRSVQFPLCSSIKQLRAPLAQPRVTELQEGSCVVMSGREECCGALSGLR
ncbi:hypothetical protein E2C01_046874 [Portunus trituberculatus]|uniref:Uncharacterized protein n=1 Tax=Portunus trituberculatus TaxID=210409 RepID=A0A5B7FZP5_PORTR|nr:hypothetical protein [Portunus trituberculatus]